MKQKITLTETDLHRMIKESVRQVLRENDVLGFDFADAPHYYAEVFILDGDMVDSENFKTLKSACKWAKEQVEGKNAPYPDCVSEVWYVDEYGDMEETDCYYGNWG